MNSVPADAGENVSTSIVGKGQGKVSGGFGEELGESFSIFEFI